MRERSQLKQLREEAALSLRDLAEKSGVAHDTIREIEQGEREPRPSTIRKLADALEVEPSALHSNPLSEDYYMFLLLYQLAEHSREGRPWTSDVSFRHLRNIWAHRGLPDALSRATGCDALKDAGADAGANASIKIIVYPENGEPEVTDVSASPRAASGKVFRMVMERVQALGGRVPHEALRELIDNLIHANFKGAMVSILEDGNVVRVSDHGPGIEDKARAFKFGYSGATVEALRQIRGVGAGLGIARAAAERSGGNVTLDDNIGYGTVAEISMPEVSPVADATWKYPDAVPKMNVSKRQQKVLITVLEFGEVGPSTVSDRLGISVSTAYRDLSILEEHGLVTSAESGKRMITPIGRDLVGAILATPGQEVGKEVRATWTIGAQEVD